MADFLILPFVEIEIRLGTKNQHFDSNVDKVYFEKIKSFLETGTWKSIEINETVEYINENLRLISPDNKVIMKENILKKDILLKDLPFDIRFSINQEFKLDTYITKISKNESVVRTKNRKSFISDDFRYDLTIVNQKVNGINTLKHEIEIELLINKSTLTWTSEYIYDFLECKVYDILNIVEPIERTLIKLN